LNDFLQKFALINQKADSSRTYVATKEGQVIGFFSLVVGSLEYSPTSGRVAAGLPAHPIPTVVIARLGVAEGFKKQGIGSKLLKDALSKALGVSETIGVRAVIVDAKDEYAKVWYESFGFAPLPGRPMTLFMLMKDIRLVATRSADVVHFKRTPAA
jgi:GNAT superfamily N-acetyltransferase